MPEEVNRVVADHLSSLSFCPTDRAVSNLAREGIGRGVHMVGDVMYDAFLEYVPIARGRRPGILAQDDPQHGFALATIHRADNTDSLEHLSAIISGLGAGGLPVVLPAHPRTQMAIQRQGLDVPDGVTICEPVGYLDMLALEDAAEVIVTDSGGVQKEAYFLGTPCVTVRDTTEWPETVDAGWNTLVGVDSSAIANAVRQFRPSGERKPVFGDGHAAEKIVNVLVG
jgi:UDP-N-acetylglucosamine 2-epimerase